MLKEAVQLYDMNYHEIAQCFNHGKKPKKKKKQLINSMSHNVIFTSEKPLNYHKLDSEKN